MIVPLPPEKWESGDSGIPRHLCEFLASAARICSFQFHRRQRPGSCDRYHEDCCQDSAKSPVAAASAEAPLSVGVRLDWQAKIPSDSGLMLEEGVD